MSVVSALPKMESNSPRICSYSWEIVLGLPVFFDCPRSKCRNHVTRSRRPGLVHSDRASNQQSARKRSRASYFSAP